MAKKSLNFTCAFKCYQNIVTSKNVSWPHFSWATLYMTALQPVHLHAMPFAILQRAAVARVHPVHSISANHQMASILQTKPANLSHYESAYTTSTPNVAIFLLPHDAVGLHYSAKRGLAITCRLSVCLSVTLVDSDHIGWKSWKLIARSISPTYEQDVGVVKETTAAATVQRSSSQFSASQFTKYMAVRYTVYIFRYV